MLDRAAFLRPIAHRGLHDLAAGIVENTAPAFEAAIARGYGIECDLRPAAGGLPVVFHDEKLARLIGGRGVIGTIDRAKLGTLRHRTGGAPIATFDDALALVAGRVPLLVEIKSEWAAPDHAFLEAIARSAAGYAGPIALMSFDPAVMMMIKDLAPAIARGIVSGSFKGAGWWPGKIGAGRAAMLRDLRESESVEPDFYAYQVDALPTPETERARAAGLPLFTWTVRNEKQRQIAARWADAMIFEGFEP